MQRDLFSQRAYVLGEILVSLAIIVGSFLALFYGEDQSVKIVAGAALGSVTTFWFARRQAEQSNMSISQLADGKLTQLLDAQAAQQQRTDAVVALMAELQARHGG